MDRPFHAPQSLSRRRFFEGVAGFGALTLIAACSSSSDSKSTSAPTTAGSPTTGGATTTGGSATTAGGSTPATSAAATTTPGSAPELAGEFKLAWVLPTTGPLVSSFGPLYIAAQMAMDDLNATTGILGKKVVKEDYDDQATAAQEPAVFRKISEDGLHYVVGPTSTSASLAAVAVSSDLKIITSSNANATVLGDASKNPYNFQFTYTIQQMANTATSGAIKDLGAKKIGILAEDTAFGAEHTQVAQDIVKNNPGVEIVGVEKYALDTPDMTTSVQNLKSAGADTVLAWQTNLPNMQAAFKALQALSWNPTFVGSSLGIAIGPVSEAAGATQVAKTYTIQLKPWTRVAGQKLGGKQRAFFERVAANPAAKGRELGVAGQSLYDFVTLLGKTINEVGEDDPTKVRDALQQVTGYEGMGGTFTFTPQLHSGLTADSIVLGSLGSLSEPESEGFFMARVGS